MHGGVQPWCFSVYHRTEAARGWPERNRAAADEEEIQKRIAHARLGWLVLDFWSLDGAVQALETRRRKLGRRTLWRHTTASPLTKCIAYG